jgi:outer membrane cobalamin receptor
LANHPGLGIPEKIMGSLSLSFRRVVGFALVCLLGAGPVAADTATAPAGATTGISPFVADTLVVRARALTDGLAPAAGGLVTRLDLDDETGSRDAADELAQVAGIQVRRYGGAGFAAVPALRGASAAQIRLFLDGMPLNSAETGGFDLDKLPTERFSAAEVHRGAVPAGWGGMGGAGAINFITRDRAEGADLRLFTGSDGDRGGRLTWGTTAVGGNRSVLLMAHGRRADNDYSFTDHNQTFENTTDDTIRTRENAWFQEWGVWGAARQATENLEARFTAGYFRKDGGRPGPLNHPSPSASVRYQRANGQAVLQWRGNLSLELAGATEKQFLYDPENEIEDGFGGTISSRAQDATGRLSWSGNLWTHDGGRGLLSGVDLVAGLEEQRQWYRQYYGPDPDPMRSRQTTSAFAGATFHLANQRLQVLPAVRWQRNEDDFPPLPPLPWLPEEGGVLNTREDRSPSLGAVWEISRDRLFLQGHTARSVRVPTWIELFGHRGGIDGNRDLQPEEITSTDLAMTWQSSGGDTFGRLAWFHAATDQAIVFFQNSPGSSKAMNIGSTRTRGWEFEGSLKGPATVRLTGNLTWQEALDQGEDPTYRGNDLPFLSDMVIWTRLSSQHGPWRPWLEVSWESGRYRDRANTELDRAPGRELLNLGLAREFDFSWLQPAGRLTVAAEVVNLTDNTVYDIEEFPLPGRSWQLSARVGG